jgi:hypothetical protein
LLTSDASSLPAVRNEPNIGASDDGWDELILSRCQLPKDESGESGR